MGKTLDVRDVPHELLVVAFDFIERHADTLRDLAAISFRLGVNWDQLSGGTVSDKGIALILHSNQRMRFDELLCRLAQSNPESFSSFQDGELLDILYALANGFIQQADSPDSSKRAETILRSLNKVSLPYLRKCLCPDLAERVAVFKGQQAWEEAESLLSGLHDALPDVDCINDLLIDIQKPRAAYEQADKMQQESLWDKARHTFHELDKGYPGYRDVASRLAELQQWETWYTTGQSLWDSGRWDESAVPFGKLVGEQPAYKDANKKLQVLHHCQALDDEGQRRLADRRRLAKEDAWDKVESLFAEIDASLPGYRGAPLHRLAVQALRAINHKEWAQADRALTELATRKPNYADVNELLAAVRRLQATINGLFGGLVHDPWLRWTGRHPYFVFQEAGLNVTPASSMQEIKAVSYDLQQGGMSPERRRALDDLRDAGRRLFVDAFLYQAGQVNEIVAWMEDEMAGSFQQPSAQALVKRFPQQAAVVLVLLERSEAAKFLESGRKVDLNNVEAAHHLGVFYLAQAEEMEAEKQIEEAERAWRQAIGQWAVVLTDEEYWEGWGEKRADCYGQMISLHHVETLRARLEEDLLRRLSEGADRHARAKRSGPADAYRQLQLEFQAELAAVRQLKKLGGIPTAQHGHVACGPSLLGSLQLSNDLARHVARLTEEPSSIEAVLSGAPSEVDVRRLRQIFSSLRLAVLFLEGAQPQPERALELLNSANCGQCPPCYDPFCPVHGNPTPGIRVCCGRCFHFEERNPAYALLQGRGEWLHEDALRLAAEAHLRVAEDRITREERWNVQATRVDWQSALNLARHWGGEEIVTEAIRSTATARSAVLGRDPKLHPDTGRLDRAVALLEMVASLTGENRSMELKLGDLLTARGIYKANRDDHQGAVQDLERAFRLMSHSHRTRDQYATALAFLASDTGDHDRAKALEMLDLAQRLVGEGQLDRPDYADYPRTLTLIGHVRAEIEGGSSPLLTGDPFAELDIVLGDHGDQSAGKKGTSSLLVQASRLRRDGDSAGVLETLTKAWELTPNDQDVQEELVEAIAEHAGQLLTAGAAEEQQQLVETWRERFGGYPSLLTRLDYMQWAPLIRYHLDRTGLKYRYGARQAILFPFDSPVVGTLMVRLSIEGSAVCLVGSLPPISDEDQPAVLGNLLQEAAEVMFYRPSSVEYVGLALMSWMPARYLDPPWLEFLIRGAARYADVQPASLRQSLLLQAHFRSQRGILGLSLPKRPGMQRPSDSLESLCRSAGWPCSRRDDKHNVIEMPFGLVEAVTVDEGIRLTIDLGSLRSADDRAALFRRMVSLNSKLGPGKLALTDRGRVHLLCEWPGLDQVGLTEAMDLFKQRSVDLRQELTIQCAGG